MTVASPENSTNVRNVLPLSAALALRVGAALAPAWTAERAIDRFLGTTRRAANEAQATFRASGERIGVEVDGAAVVARSWGRGPAVYLLHGWNGSATDFRHVVPALVGAGFRAVAVEAPGHGESDGDSASAVHLARALVAAVDAIGPARAVVAHSFGAAAAAFALARGTLRTDRLVLVAPVADPIRYLELVSAGLDRDFAARLVATLERRVGVLAAELALGASARRIEVPVLVVHDTEDRETRVEPVAEVVAGWPSARLVRTDGLGHRRVLADPAVLDAIVGAVNGTTVRACPHGRLADTCAACALEQELFRRDDRAA